jgi:pimeloyl-ACP methyl ester carboxylesterase
MTSTPENLLLTDGRTLRVHDNGASTDSFTIVWHNGSPHSGALIEPLLLAAADRGIRIVSYARPSYGGSTPVPERDVASAAADVAELADALGVDRFAVMGASGGGPHALACAALLPGRVSAAAVFASLAPFDADIDFYAGMAGGGPSLRAAEQGRDARELFEQTADFDPARFNARDYALLDGSWAALGADVGASEEWGSDGLVTDDLAFVIPWGFDVASITAPVLVVQGGDDRVIPRQHGEWLSRHLEAAELWLRPRDGHVSILDSVPLAMDWLRAHS